jgi:hypothetical protein
MWSVCLRCLVLIVSLALASGNAHAGLNTDDVHSGRQQQVLHHRPAAHSDHPTSEHEQSKGGGCCCDCLGCTAAADVIPALVLTPLQSGVSIRLERHTAFPAGRALGPELDPPRPSALI